MVRNLARAGVPVTVFDQGIDPHRLRLIMTETELARARFITGDITDLTALRVPFCRADPPLGARVNVVGTVNAFEAAKRAGLSRLVYASSFDEQPLALPVDAAPAQLPAMLGALPATPGRRRGADDRAVQGRAGWRPAAGPSGRVTARGAGVLALSRILYRPQHGVVVSKPAAARWALATWDRRWWGLIERAVEGRHHPRRAAQGDDIRETLELIRSTTDATMPFAKTDAR